MQRSLAIALCVVINSFPAMADKSACCRPGWEASDLLAAEGLLDGICRGSTNSNEDMKGYSCQARQAVISALDKLGWCYGKTGQIEADMRWHKCMHDLQHTDLQNLHSYDWDERTHSYINQ